MIAFVLPTNPSDNERLRLARYDLFVKWLGTTIGKDDTSDYQVYDPVGYVADHFEINDFKEVHQKHFDVADYIADLPNKFVLYANVGGIYIKIEPKQYQDYIYMYNGKVETACDLFLVEDLDA